MGKGGQLEPALGQERLAELTALLVPGAATGTKTEGKEKFLQGLRGFLSAFQVFCSPGGKGMGKGITGGGLFTKGMEE